MAAVDPSQTKEDAVPLEGIVDEVIRDVFWVIVPSQPGLRVKCHLSGKLRKHNIRITPGDTVDIQVSPYDLQSGRIVYRRS